LVAKYPTYQSKALFMQLMIEDAAVPDGPATRDQLDSWINARKVQFPMFIDAEGSPAFTLKKLLGPRETGYTVELATMKILLRSAVGQYTKNLDLLDTL
jgi:hypothetical protein